MVGSQDVLRGLGARTGCAGILALVVVIAGCDSETESDVLAVAEFSNESTATSDATPVADAEFGADVVPALVPEDACGALPIVYVPAGGAWFNGSGQAECIIGTAGNDRIRARAGNDVVVGLGGDDLVEGGNGDDQLIGGEGNDILRGEAGADTLLGEDGADTLEGAGGADHLDGGAGDDALDGGADPDVLFGRDGNDVLVGGGADDIVTGGEGDDTLEGGAGNDTIAGEAGNDVIEGQGGNDVIDGGPGNDSIDGGGATDTISGGAGNDAIDGGPGSDALDGGEGDDTIFGTAVDSSVEGGPGNDACDGLGCEEPEPGATPACTNDDDCVDGNACTADVCDVLFGCLHPDTSASCDDGLFCSGIESCDALSGCVSGTAPGTDDGVSCTIDLCDEATASVVHLVNDDACDDDEACTTDACDPLADCTHDVLVDGSSCDDGSVCNGIAACAAGVCTPGLPLMCDDGDLCNGTETCDPLGGCIAGAPPICEDGNACTYEGCDPVLGCQMYIPDDGTSCADGEPCNGDETCIAGTCRPGAALDCDDDQECTAESCAPGMGCQYAAVVDGVPCGGGAAHCSAGRCLGALELVSRGMPGPGGNRESAAPSVTPDGRFVAFTSTATNLVPGHSGSTSDVFVLDRETLAIELVSVAVGGDAAAGNSSDPSISADGRYVAFSSNATDLVAGPSLPGVFLRDRLAGTTARASVAADGTPADGMRGRVSGDGRIVAFISRMDIVPGDTNGRDDAFARDMQAGFTHRVSLDVAGAQFPGGALDLAIAGSGHRVAFVAGNEVYVRDRLANTTVLASVDALGGPSGGASSPSMSSNGLRVAFVSRANDLVMGPDTLLSDDVFVRDLGASSTTRVSVTPLGSTPNAISSAPRISPDGGFVAFESTATDLVVGDTNARRDVFLRDLAGGATTLVALHEDGTQSNDESVMPALSDAATLVAFASDGTNLVDGDVEGRRDVFVRDREALTTERVSEGEIDDDAAGDSVMAAASHDGRFVAFRSSASNLVEGDRNRAADVFVWDAASGVIERVSVGVASEEETQSSSAPAISADGRYVAFDSSRADLVATDTNNRVDVFLRDREAMTTERVSVDAAGFDADDGSFGASISADGRFVAFVSSATDLVAGDTNDRTDVFVRDRLAGTTSRASVASDGTQANLESSSPRLAADGSRVVFASRAANLVAGDTNNSDDVFVHDLATRQTVRASVAFDGTQADLGSARPDISADGRFVVFDSIARNLTGAPERGLRDVFVRDLELDTITRISESYSGIEAGGNSARVSADGRFVVFLSTAQTLVFGTSPTSAAYLRDVETGETALVSGVGAFTAAASFPAISGDGARIVLSSPFAGFVASDDNGVDDVFWAANAFLADDAGGDDGGGPILDVGGVGDGTQGTSSTSYGDESTTVDGGTTTLRLDVAGDGGETTTTSPFDVGVPTPPPTEMWSALLDSGGVDAGEGIAIAPNGEVIVTGWIVNANGGLWRLDDGGNMLGAFFCDCVPWNYYYGVDVSPSGEIAVGTTAYGGNFNDPAVRLFEPGGGLLWSRAHLATDYFVQWQATRAVAFLADGSIVAVGWTFNGIDRDVYLGRFDLAGDVLSSESLDWGDHEDAWDVAATDDGGWTLVGSSGPAGTREALLVHFAANGDELAFVTQDLGGDEVARAVALGPDGPLLAGSYAFSDMSGEVDAFVIALDADGVLVTDHRNMHAGGDDEFWDVAVDDVGRVYAAGWQWNGADSDGLLRLVDLGSGSGTWDIVIDGGGTDRLTGVATDGTRIVVAGAMSGATSDVFVAQYGE
ncbi:MAG TPA: hypothetical protein VG755_07830 [Nannocystaceae bacterium]|nr:hypothetical protein [Nannocystaceae bacterium]